MLEILEPPQVVSGWHKSSRSDQLANVSCVEQATTTVGAAWRDSKTVDNAGVHHGDVIYSTRQSTMTFLNALNAGLLGSI